MLSLVNLFASWNLKRRIRQIEYFMANPVEVQTEHFLQMIRAAALTEWGKVHNYSDIQTIDDFRKQVPVSRYEDIFPYIERMMNGESDILWHGTVEWFAKSSGTSNDKSKYIPITEASLHDCHYKAGRDLLAIYFHYHNPDSHIFNGKILSIGGSHEQNQHHAKIRYGDLSAVLLENLPVFFEWIRTPSKKVALMSNWEEKLEAMCNEVLQEDVRAIVGVPTWTMVLIQKMFEKKDISNHNLSRIWGNLEVFFHGGVNFAPYKENFKALLKHNIHFVNIYNASEGFFGIQLVREDEDMLLMLDYGIFYEFALVEDLSSNYPTTYTLGEVVLNQSYAMIISTNGGLWRYIIGDTVTFTSLLPHKIKITGRTKHFINAFGEELMVDNAERGIEEACRATNALVKEYTAAPIYFSDTEKRGGHQWLVEFEKLPNDLKRFEQVLDQTMQRLNSDYEAKRKGDMILKFPLIQVVPQGTFYAWMKQRGKLGGQHKVPRLSNSRDYIENILALLVTK